MAEFADEMKVEFHHTVNELGFAVVPIGEEITDTFRQGIAIFFEMVEIPVNPCLVWVVELRRLAGGEVVSGIVGHIHYRQARDLQTLFWPAMLAVVEDVQTMGMFAAFVGEAAIDRGNQAITAR
jgi:hypothetical protein